MRIAILGFGREGKSLLRFLKHSPKFKNAEFWILDKNPKLKLSGTLKSQLGKDYIKNLKKFDIIFRSPGIPYNLPELKKARRAGVKFSSSTKLFFDNCPAQIIGVTGSKGKTTTAILIYKILKAAGFKAFLAGNVGRAALEILPKLDKKSWVVLELSSFQLQDLKTSPHIAVVLDIFPEHQDYHASLSEYYNAKANITRYQKRNDLVFYFSHNRLSKNAGANGLGRKIAVSERGSKLFHREDVRVPGFHNFYNAAMAAEVAHYLKIPSGIIRRIIKNFRGIEQRLELVRKLGQVKFYNDSASTNPETSAAAIRAFPDEKKILIAGGQDKNLNYKPLAQALKNSNTKLAVLFGENKNKIRKAIKSSGIPIKRASNLKTAITATYVSAKSIIGRSKSSVVVLFSPGAASFDMFKNYADRGGQFKKIVRSLT